jgi:hypothetical protein
MSLIGEEIGPDESVCLRGGWCLVVCRATTKMVVAVSLELDFDDHALLQRPGRGLD